MKNKECILPIFSFPGQWGHLMLTETIGSQTPPLREMFTCKIWQNGSVLFGTELCVKLRVEWTSDP